VSAAHRRSLAAIVRSGLVLIFFVLVLCGRLGDIGNSEAGLFPNFFVLKIPYFPLLLIRFHSCGENPSAGDSQRQEKEHNPKD
jgi:hypothetical protein